MWNAFIVTGNLSLNIVISECNDFNSEWDSIAAYNYVLDKIEKDQPFISENDVVYIRDKKGIKNIRIHRI